MVYIQVVICPKCECFPLQPQPKNKFRAYLLEVTQRSSSPLVSGLSNHLNLSLSHSLALRLHCLPLSLRLRLRACFLAWRRAEDHRQDPQEVPLKRGHRHLPRADPFHHQLRHDKGEISRAKSLTCFFFLFSRTWPLAERTNRRKQEYTKKKTSKRTFFVFIFPVKQKHVICRSVLSPKDVGASWVYKKLR